MTENITDKSADIHCRVGVHTQSSLPLFDDPPVPGSPKAPSVNGHLLEARRLARRMRRLRNQREEQTRTGQAICHHLKAMLTESRPPS